MSFLHVLSGVRIESNVPLPTAGAASAPDGLPVAIRFRAGALPAPASAPLELKVGTEEEPVLSIGKRACGYLLRLHDHADFWVSADGSEIVCAAVAGEPPESIEQLLVDHVLPMILQLAGRPTLHASAVELARGRVVAFVGASGSGKSTLAASLCALGNLVCDDCLALSPGPSGVVVHPSYGSVRLWADSADAIAAGRARAQASPASSKLRVSARAAAGVLHLERIYVLGDIEGPPRIEPLRRRDALLALTLHVHRLDPEPRRLLTRELDWLAELARVVPVARLRYARRYDGVAAVHAAIGADLTNSPGQGFSLLQGAPH